VEKTLQLCLPASEDKAAEINRKGKVWNVGNGGRQTAVDLMIGG
jgi:hypothetical protein